MAYGQVHSRRLLRQADYLSTCVPTATAGKQRSEIRDQRSAWSTSRGGAATYGRTAPWGAKLPMQSILRANLIPSIRLNDIRGKSCPFIGIHLSDGRPGQNPSLRTSADGVPFHFSQRLPVPRPSPIGPRWRRSGPDRSCWLLRPHQVLRACRAKLSHPAGRAHRRRNCQAAAPAQEDETGSTSDGAAIQNPCHPL